MFECEKCGKGFRDKRDVIRHMSRIKPCKPIEFSKNIPHFSNSTANIPNDTKTIPNNTIQCIFCLRSFVNVKKHQLICKSKDDPIRVLELCQNIKIDLPTLKTECRFCNHSFSRIGSLYRHFKTCKERKDYHSNLLLNENKTINQTVNNINNGTINNITINLLGNEDTSHIDLYKVLNNLKTFENMYGKEHIYIQAGEMVISYDDYLRENPKNQNIFLPNIKCPYVELKTEEGWEKVECNTALNESFKNSAKLLYNTKVEINNKVLNEVGEFSKIGFEHYHARNQQQYDGEKNYIKKKYKISKLKNKKTKVV